MTEQTNATRAARARVAFQASDHAKQDNDPLTNLYDLVCDLMHYADTITNEEEAGMPGIEAGPDRETFGAYVARMAEWHYECELAEEARRPEPKLPTY